MGDGGKKSCMLRFGAVFFSCVSRFFTSEFLFWADDEAVPLELVVKWRVKGWL